MASKGINGCNYFQVGTYHIKDILPSPQCNDCQFLQKKSGSVGAFGEFKYICSGITTSVASKYGQGIAVSNPSKCDAYKSGSGGSSGPHGGGFGASAGKNIMGGLGQTLGAGSVDDVAGGVGKVGLGLGKLAGAGLLAGGKGIAAGIGHIKDAAVRAKEERDRKIAEDKRQAAELLAEINRCDFTGDKDAVMRGISRMLELVDWCAEIDIDSHDSVRDAAGEKAGEGIQALRDQGEAAVADLFREKLDNTVWGKQTKVANAVEAAADNIAGKVEGALNPKMDALSSKIDGVSGKLEGFMNKKMSGLFKFLKVEQTGDEEEE